MFCGRKKLLFGGIAMLISMFSRRGKRFHNKNLCFQKAKILPMIRGAEGGMIGGPVVISCFNMFQSFFAKL